MGIVVAGNWKMNHGPAEARAFLDTLETPAEATEVTVLVFPPVVSLTAAANARSDAVLLGVQNIHPERAGAFTGEVSAEMAAEAGAVYVLVGHSERRQLFGERDEETLAKVTAALRAGLIPLLCVGETRDERRAGRLEEVLLRQLDAVLLEGSVRAQVADGSPLLLAYEPVWAIGTGDTATPADATEAHGILRHRLETLLSPRVAGGTPILYGGSASPENAAELLSAPGVDGLLIGGASLDPRSFSRIIETALQLC